MLGNLDDQVSFYVIDSWVADRKSVHDGRKFAGFKLDIHNRTDYLYNFSNCLFCAHLK
jgi:hypothetical protein